jgi:hypothetical protein
VVATREAVAELVLEDEHVDQDPLDQSDPEPVTLEEVNGVPQLADQEDQQEDVQPDRDAEDPTARHAPSRESAHARTVGAARDECQPAGRRANK